MEAEHQRGPTLSSRALAIIHLAMHDAFFGIAGVAAIPNLPPGSKNLYLLAPIDPPLPPPNSLITRNAAVSGAASTALCTLYSGMRAMIEEKLAAISGENDTDDAAFSFGRRVALAVLATRANDEKVLPKDLDHVSSPGHCRHRVDPYNPTQDYLGVGYGNTSGFAVTTWQTLDSPPLKSDARDTDDFKEVYERGGTQDLNTTKRTPEQTAIGLYWAYDGVNKIGTPPRLYNQIVREVAKREQHHGRKRTALCADQLRHGRLRD